MYINRDNKFGIDKRNSETNSTIVHTIVKLSTTQFIMEKNFHQIFTVCSLVYNYNRKQPINTSKSSKA